MSNFENTGKSLAKEKPPIPMPNILTMVNETFGISRRVTASLLILIGLMVVAAGYFVVHSAPPGTIILTSGPEGSIFFTNACKYISHLKLDGVKLVVLPSHGSLDNLQRLENSSFNVDVGFVQGGLTNGQTDNLVSLGSVSYQPLLVFYRGEPVDSLAALAGRRLGVGSPGSGTHNLALTLLGANGIKVSDTNILLEWDAAKAVKGLVDGTVDAVFLMGEDASAATLRQLLTAPDIHLLNFAQAEAYSRKFTYLSILKLPQGGIDLGKNIPAHDVYLVGPTVELIARKGLHPALSDLLLETARLVHGNPSLFQHKGEFPSPLEHDIHISDDAARFYRSGTGFFYHYLPFWLASMTSRILVIFVPMIVILIPVLRSIPHLYRWRNQARIYRWYRALLVLEKDTFKEADADRRKQLLQRLDEIETEVNKMKVPGFLANQFYGLREHIALVRKLASDRTPR